MKDMAEAPNSSSSGGKGLTEIESKENDEDLLSGFFSDVQEKEKVVMKDELFMHEKYTNQG
jgi:hypothetical protein